VAELVHVFSSRGGLGAWVPGRGRLDPWSIGFVQELAAAGLEVSAGKMAGWWTGTHNTVRLDELDVLCHVLVCDPSALLIP